MISRVDGPASPRHLAEGDTGGDDDLALDVRDVIPPRAVHEAAAADVRHLAVGPAGGDRAVFCEDDGTWLN